MASEYNKQGVRFDYPENWEIFDEDFDAVPRTVSLQSPASTVWSLHVYPHGAESQILVNEVLKSMQAEYESLEAEPVLVEIGQIPAFGHNMNFYCLDLVVHAESRCFQTDTALYLVLSQAESRDFDEHQRVLDAITLTLTLPPDLRPAPLE